MRKFVLSTVFALLILGSVSISSAEARPWRGGYYYPSYGVYAAPNYNYSYYPPDAYSGYYAPNYYYSRPGYYYGWRGGWRGWR